MVLHHHQNKWSFWFLNARVFVLYSKVFSNLPCSLNKVMGSRLGIDRTGSSSKLSFIVLRPRVFIKNLEICSLIPIQFKPLSSPLIKNTLKLGYKE